MRVITILAVVLAVALLAVIGCERTVTETVVVNDNTDCFTCHGDEGPLLQAKGEWENSTHASGNSVDYTNRGGSDCTQCHNHQGFLEFLATGAVSAPYDNVSAIHCFTCHAPHERGDLSLRTEDPFVLANGVTFDFNEGNLCANCHHSRIDVATIVDNFNVTSTHWGPHHGPQGDMLAATNGYEFDGYTYQTSTHGTAIDNACAGCHMGDPQIHQGYDVGGHSFEMEDGEGNDLSAVCEGCHASADEYDFLANADYDWDGATEGYQTEMIGVADSLMVLLEAAGVASGGHPVTGVIADGNVAGALFNYLLFEEDQSHGIHNYKYIYGLLESSIMYLNGDLGATVSSERLAAAH